jgi:uncharacterized pyridoxamine 5'-phosphate oxidase family protein
MEKTTMNKAVLFLRDCGTFYLATEEEGQPRVRPFGAVIEYEGKTYICTNNTKRCFKQMIKNPKIEISATKGGEWIRVTAEAVVDPDRAVKQRMLEEVPSLKNLYKVDDDIFEVLYLANATATIYSFAGQPESLGYKIPLYSIREKDMVKSHAFFYSASRRNKQGNLSYPLRAYINFFNI